jgi:hypothetical protein
MVTREHLARLNHDGEAATLHELYSDEPEQDRADENPQTFQRLFDLARGMYETSRYLFYDNAVNDGKGEKAASGGVEPEGAR